MKSWLPMIVAGLVALIGGIIALLNPATAGIATTTVVGWALVIVALLQAWATYRSKTTGAKMRAGAITLATAFLGLSLLFGPFGDGTLLRWLIIILLLASGASKIYAARAMHSAPRKPLAYGAGAVSLALGALILFGVNLNLGILLGNELLSTGVALIVLAMDKRAHSA